ncbi:hypothetical protein BLA55_01020 [Mycoplasmopsis pullorum]|uniref:Uncharacterized protein n=2 Tax=Mycoplasmopsis pullorum TaxID=48003 RepID=A0A1L4FRP7_9BACT|nr:hypothetical protein BLA55_01020 [Mycoplasmopsis pullorum]
MNKHSKFSWLNILETTKRKLGFFKTNKSNKTYIYLDKNILLSNNLEIIEKYLISTKERIQILSHIQPIVVIPNIHAIFNFLFSNDQNQIKNKQEIIRTIKLFLAEIRRNGLFVFFEMDINDIYEYESNLKRILDFKDFESGKTEKNNYWVQKKQNAEEKYDVSDFLKTQALNLNLSESGENKFKLSLYYVLKYFKESFLIDGIVFTNLTNFVFLKNKNDIKDSLNEMDYLLSKASLDMKIKFLLKEEIFDKKLFKEFKKMNVFIDIVYNVEIKKQNFKDVLKTITYYNKKGISPFWNFYLSEFINNNQITTFYSIDYITSWLTLLFLISPSILINYFNNFDKFDVNFKNFLIKNFNFEKDVVSANLDMEKYLIDFLSKVHKFYYQMQIPISQVHKVKISFVNKNLVLFKIKLEERNLIAYYNLSKKNFFLDFSGNKLIFNSKYELLDRKITPYQVLVFEK